MRRRFGILVLGLLVPGAFGRAETFTVDPGQSDVAFSLADVFHFGHGKLHVESGTVQFDLARQISPAPSWLQPAAARAATILAIAR